MTQQNPFMALNNNEHFQSKEVEAASMDIINAGLNNLQKKKTNKKREELPSKTTTFTMPPVIRKILTEQRLKNAPLMSDSRYLSQLIYKDKYGKELYNTKEKGSHQLFAIDPETGDEL